MNNENEKSFVCINLFIRTPIKLRRVGVKQRSIYRRGKGLSTLPKERFFLHDFQYGICIRGKNICMLVVKLKNCCFFLTYFGVLSVGLVEVQRSNFESPLDRPQFFEKMGPIQNQRNPFLHLCNVPETRFLNLYKPGTPWYLYLD